MRLTLKEDGHSEFAGRSNRYPHRNFILDSHRFPYVLVDELLGSGVRQDLTVVDHVRFADHLCHRCNSRLPELRYCVPMYGGEFRQRYGWYIGLESYKGAASSLRPVANDGADAAQLGERSLWLDGQVFSSKIGKALGGLCNRTVLVSLRARGAGGHLRLALRGYSYPPDERFLYQAEVLKADTGEQWRTYSAVVFVSYGQGLYRASVELEGDGVFVDDVRLTALGQTPTGEALQVSIPVAAAAGCPKADGVFSAEEWGHAAWLTGFANLSTGSLALRQGRVGLLSDGQSLFVCARWPAEHGTTANATARDSAVWQDDAVEVYLGPSSGAGVANDLYQFVANSRGALFDQRLAAGTRQGDAKWDSSALLASTVADGWWTLEMAIPLAEVGVRGERTFGLQLCRDFVWPAEYTSLTGAPFRTLFPCRLSPAAPALNWTLDGDLAGGAVNLT